MAGWERNVGRAQDADTEPGIFLTVQNPITSDAFTRIKNQINVRLNSDNQSRPRLTHVVFDFNPDNKPAATTDFGPCYDLAKFIGTLKGLNTIAFSGRVRGRALKPGRYLAVFATNGSPTAQTLHFRIVRH